ncbi:MAG: SDR family NAD(P)-dependent oxidoreductase, partial [Patescibacteria group bacterium]
MFNLKEKVALVTGARRGMGRAHALALAEQGAIVVVTDIDLNECSMVVDEVTAKGGRAVCYAMDVSNKEEVDAVITKIVEEFGRLDILVNNAGIYHPTPAFEISEEEWGTTMDINLKGQFLCAQRAGIEMKKNGWGRIINITSVASGQVGVGLAGGVHYSATKGGIIAMTESLAVEWAKLGINVNAIAPGAIDTDMSRSKSMPKGALDA